MHLLMQLAFLLSDVATPRDPLPENAAVARVAVRRAGVVVDVGAEPAHRHSVVVRISGPSRSLGAGLGVPEMAASEAERQLRQAGVEAVPIPASDDAARDVLMKCVPSRTGRVRSQCIELYRALFDRHRIDAVVVVKDDDRAARHLDDRRASPGIGVLTRRREDNELRALPFAWLRVAVVLAQTDAAAIGKSCIDDVRWHRLESDIDVASLTLAQLPWLRDELQGAFEVAIERALARSGVSPGHLAECDPKEGRRVLPFDFSHNK